MCVPTPACPNKEGSSMLRKVRLYFQILNGFPISAESQLSPGSFVRLRFFQQEICNRGSRCNVVIIKILLKKKKQKKPTGWISNALLLWDCQGFPFSWLHYLLAGAVFSSKSASQLCAEKNLLGKFETLITHSSICMYCTAYQCIHSFGFQHFTTFHRSAWARRTDLGRLKDFCFQTLMFTLLCLLISWFYFYFIYFIFFLISNIKWVFGGPE